MSVNVEKNVNTRIQNKHDIEANWKKAINFIPKEGELIIYDPDPIDQINGCFETRFKIGDGVTTVTNLPFFTDFSAAKKDYVDEIFDTYILNIDYDSLLSYDITEQNLLSSLGEGLTGSLILGL